MDAVKRLLATEGQNRSVMKESSLWSVAVKRKKLNRFCVCVCVFIYLPHVDYQNIHSTRKMSTYLGSVDIFTSPYNTKHH